MKNFTSIIWIILFFAYFEGFGLRTNSWGGLGHESLGLFGVIQLSFLVLSLLLVVTKSYRHNFNNRSSISKSVKLIFFLIVVIAIQSVFQSFDKNNPSLAELLQNLIKFKNIYIYFIFVYLLNQKNGLTIAFNSINLAAIISCVIVVYIYLFKFEQATTNILISNDVTRSFRIIMPTAMLISFSFFYYLTKYFTQKKLRYAIIALITFCIVFMQMHRTVIISLIIVTLFAVLVLLTFNIKQILRISLIIFMFIFTISFVFNFINYDTSVIGIAMLDTSDEIQNIEGNFGVRVMLPINSIKHVISNYLIIGVGLNWEELKDFESYVSLTKYYATPTFDSGYNNIIVIFGLTGLTVFLILFRRLFTQINNIIKSQKGERKIIAYTLLFTLTYILLTAVASDNFILHNSSVIFTLIISLTYYIELQIRNKNNIEPISKNNSKTLDF